MAFTSNWMWESRNRVLDVNVDSAGTRTTRNNWTMIRSRHSNASFASQLGEETDVLNASSGGTSVSEFTGEKNYVQFGTTQDWTDTTYKYYADYDYYRVGSGGERQYCFEIDRDNFTNKPDDTKTTIVRPRLRVTSAGAWYWWWECGEWDIDSALWHPTDTKSYVKYNQSSASYPELSSITVSPNATPQTWYVYWSYFDGGVYAGVTGSVYGSAGSVKEGRTKSISNEVSFKVESPSSYTYGPSTTFVVIGSPNDTTPTNYIKTAESSGGSANTPTDPPSLDTLSFATAAGTFSGAATASDAELAQPSIFYCASDEASHTQGVDWYKQTQTWIYKDEYV